MKKLRKITNEEKGSIVTLGSLLTISILFIFLIDHFLATPIDAYIILSFLLIIAIIAGSTIKKNYLLLVGLLFINIWNIYMLLIATFSPTSYKNITIHFLSIYKSPFSSVLAFISIDIFFLFYGFIGAFLGNKIKMILKKENKKNNSEVKDENFKK